jgi:FkbM family methyltransferase
VERPFVNRKWLERGGSLVRLARAAARTAREQNDKVVLALLNVIAGKKRASALDVFFAYRLLLGRAPDGSGFSHHRRRLEQLRLTPEQLIADFAASAEGKSRGPVSGEASAPVREQRVELDGFSILIDANDLVIGAHLAQHQTWEPDVTRAIRTLLREGDTFVDVGANIGYFTLLAARQVGPRGRVIAVEPAPGNYALLEKSLALNGLKHVEAHRIAAGASAGRARLALPDAANGGSWALVNDARSGSFEVDVQPLDALLAGRRVQVIKIDVEGAEQQVLAGLQRTLETSRPLLLLEYSGQTKMLEALEARGYRAQETARFDGKLAAQSIADLDRTLARRGDGHLDLVLFPIESR